MHNVSIIMQILTLYPRPQKISDTTCKSFKITTSILFNDSIMMTNYCYLDINNITDIHLAQHILKCYHSKFFTGIRMFWKKG